MGEPATSAENYDATMVPVIFVPWARELIARARPTDGEDILDLACGTGAVTREIANAVPNPGSLTGADYSAGMLAVARSRADAVGLDVMLVEADAGNLPFGDDSFDVAFCQQALQFFPDKPRALTELRRVLRPGGRVAMCVTTGTDENPLLKAQAAALERHAGADAGRAVRAICALADGGEIRQLFEDAGFRDVTVEHVSLTLHHPDGHAYALGAMGGMHEGDMLSRAGAREACIADFLDLMGECFDGQGLTFPHVSHVVTARV